MAQPPCGTNCFVTLINGFVRNKTLINIGTKRNKIYASQIFSGGIEINESGSTTKPLRTHYF
jgi:hypothetical protein